MYCPKCNAYNDDTAKFCINCGEALPDPATAQEPKPVEEPVVPPVAPPQEPVAPQPDPYQQNWAPQQPQQDPYRQSWDPQPQQFAPQGKQPTNVLPIVSIVISVLFGNLIALILSIVSLVNFNNYEAAMRRNDVSGAQMYADKSRKLAIAAIVLAAIGLVLMIIAFVAVAVFGLVSVSGSGGVTEMPFDFDFTTDAFSAIATLIH